MVDWYTILATPFMQKGSLETYLASHPGANRLRFVGALTMSRATLIFVKISQVAEAMEYLHDSAGLVHGDIKCVRSPSPDVQPELR